MEQKLDYDAILEWAKKEAKRQVDLQWPPDKKWERKIAEKELTRELFNQMVLDPKTR